MAIEQLSNPSSEEATLRNEATEMEVEDEMQMDIVETQIVQCMERNDSSEESEDSDDSESDDFVLCGIEIEPKTAESCCSTVQSCADQTTEEINDSNDSNDSCDSNDSDDSNDSNDSNDSDSESGLDIPSSTEKIPMSLFTSATPNAFTTTLEDIVEDEELTTTTTTTKELRDLTTTTTTTRKELQEHSANLALTTRSTSPTAEEVSQFINDKSAYIENVFKCMLRGISDSKLSMVKNRVGDDTPPSITELREGEPGATGAGGREQGVTETRTEVISPEVKIVKLIQNLDYFIDIVCSIKSSDAKDTYSIIVLYEKLIFDLKSEIFSLTKSLAIYKTIVGKGK